MKKYGSVTVVSEFTVLDLPEPQRSRSLRNLGMTADEFAAHLEGVRVAIAEREEYAIETGTNTGLHYTDGLPAAAVDGKGEPVLFPPVEPD